MFYRLKLRLMNRLFDALANAGEPVELTGRREVVPLSPGHVSTWAPWATCGCASCGRTWTSASAGVVHVVQP